GPVVLEDVDAFRAHLVCRSRGRVDDVQTPPVRGRPVDLRIRLLPVRLRALRRGLRAGAVGTEIGGEHEQGAAVGRPLDVLYRAGDLADLAAAVDPEAHAAGVAAVGRVGERLAVRRE